ncbi:MAG TPA: substrate-binding domain-containing protein [Streptosporangiaceae bacterium]|nr:substrate-binding domain-containing protein [Streptosporangiaceae bacterium]
MIVPRVDNPFFPSVVQAAERYLRSRGYALLLSTSDDDPVIEGQRVDMLVDRQVDGLLISPCHLTRSAAAIEDAARHVPVVQLDRGTDHYNGDFVAVDDANGMQQLVAHLRATGRRELAYIGGDGSSWSGAHRLEAFANLEPAATGDDRILLGEFSEEWGSRGARMLLSLSNPPDAILCGNDLIAIGVIMAAGELGVRVPEDVAVTGYDDIDLARVCRPAITTVHQPIRELTHQAIDLLLARLEEPDRPATKVLLETRLIVRASSIPPPAVTASGPAPATDSRPDRRPRRSR